MSDAFFRNPLPALCKVRFRKIRSKGKADRIFLSHRNYARIRIHTAQIFLQDASGRRDQIFGMRIELHQEA